MRYLGVDGGGTKTVFVLIDAAGRILARASRGSSCYVEVGFDRFAAVLAEGIAEVCAAAGIGPDGITFSFLGIPAYGEIAKDTPRIEAVVGSIFPHDRFRCGNDVEVGWAGSLTCRPGIHLVAGTGAIGYGRDPEGNTARAGGWGSFLGDEGSAYWLGKQLISHFTKQSDGREDKTALYEIVRNTYHIARDFDFTSVLYDEMQMKRDEIAKLALLVYEAARRNDARAIALYDAAAYEHSLTVKALLRQLRFPAGREVPVSYSGGVFGAGGLILEPLKRHLAGEPVRLKRPALLPVTGAALYAMILSGRPASGALIAELRRQEKAVGMR
ncbi:MAG: N-acetylglucosamine kinase [Patescibacteria group bacterium]